MSAPGAATSPTVPDAARFVEQFADAWAGPHPDRLLDLLQPEVRLVQPLFGLTTGRTTAQASFFGPLFRFLPDLHLEVDRWSAVGDTVFIEWTAGATLAGRPFRWSGVDRFVLAQGRAVERVAYFDALPLLGAVLRHPSSWPAFWRSGMARTWRSMLRRGAPARAPG